MSDSESSKKLSIISFYQYERDVSALVRISRENGTQRLVRTELSVSGKFPKWVLDPISLSGLDTNRLVFEISTGGMIGNTLGKTKLKLSDNTECGSYLLPVSDAGTSGWPIYAGKDQALPAPLQEWVQNSDAVSKTDGPKFPKFKLDKTGLPRIREWWMDLRLEQNVDKELDEVRKTLKGVPGLEEVRRKIDAMSNLGEQKRVSSTASSSRTRQPSLPDIGSKLSSLSRWSLKKSTEQATGGEATSGEGAKIQAKNAVGKTANKQQVADTSDKTETAKIEERLKELEDIKSKLPNTTSLPVKDKLETIEVLIEGMVIETEVLKKAAELKQSAEGNTSTTVTMKAIGLKMSDEMPVLGEIDVTNARERLDRAKEPLEAITMAAVVLILEDKEVKAKKKRPIDVLQNDLWSERVTGFLHITLTSSKSK